MQKIRPLKGLVDSQTRTYTQARPTSRTGTMSYGAFYITHDHLANCGIEVAPADIWCPVLLLGGTSIPISDRMGFIEHLLAAGYEVASIENPAGSPLDFRATPGADRAAALQS